MSEEDAAATGNWWGNVRLGGRQQTREIDAVAIDGDGAVTAIGSCKWTTERVGLGQENLLAEIEPFVPKTSADTKHYFFSLNGFDPGLEQLAAGKPEGYRLVTPAKLLGQSGLSGRQR